MSDRSEFIDLMISMCNQGCIITTNDLFYKTYRSELYLPKNMLYIDTENKKYKLHIQNIGSICTIDMKPKYYSSSNNYINIERKWKSNTNPKIIIYESPRDPRHSQNQKSISTLVNYLYTRNLETPSSAQSDLYKKELWNFMYDDCFGTNKYCFGTKQILISVIGKKYLILDITKIIVDRILRIEKWSNLGFYCR